MELTLDTGNKLQSLPKQITNDLSIVSKVNVVCSLCRHPLTASTLRPSFLA